MFARRLILFLLTLSAILGCTREGRRTQTYTDEEGVVRLLPPAVPAGEQDSMAYLLDHYWDGMSFGDTLYSHDEEFVARALRGYRPYLSAGDSAHRAVAVRSLMSRAEVDTVAYVRLMDLSEGLLYDREYYDEYLPFAEAIIESDFPSEWDKVRPQEQVRSIRLNRPGTLANDFEYVTLQGDTARMSDLRGEPLVLFFYNAPCHSCGTKADEFGKSPASPPPSLPADYGSWRWTSGATRRAGGRRSGACPRGGSMVGIIGTSTVWSSTSSITCRRSTSWTRRDVCSSVTPPSRRSSSS